MYILEQPKDTWNTYLSLLDFTYILQVHVFIRSFHLHQAYCTKEAVSWNEISLFEDVVVISANYNITGQVQYTVCPLCRGSNLNCSTHLYCTDRHLIELISCGPYRLGSRRAGTKIFPLEPSSGCRCCTVEKSLSILNKLSQTTIITRLVDGQGGHWDHISKAIYFEQFRGWYRIWLLQHWRYCTHKLTINNDIKCEKIFIGYCKQKIKNSVVTKELIFTKLEPQSL